MRDHLVLVAREPSLVPVILELVFTGYGSRDAELGTGLTGRKETESGTSK